MEVERLRFDFCHHSPMTREEIIKVERLVNQQIRANLHCEVTVMTPQEAEKKGALALFGEKYGDQVRVLSMGDFSMELCGGTHVHHSGEVGLFLITHETGIAAGIRRIEAVSGEGALEWQALQQERLDQAASLLKTDQSQLLTKLDQTVNRHKLLEKQVESLTHQLLKYQSQQLSEKAIDIQGVKVLAEQVASSYAKALRVTVDQLKQQMDDAVIILATVSENKVQLVAGVTPSYQDKLSAGQLVKFVAEQVGGRGGGRKDMAEGGGTNPKALPQALLSVEGWVKQQLG